MKEYKVLWTAPARKDLFEIIEYIASEDINIALNILDKIEEKVKQLFYFPKRGRVVPELEIYNYYMYREIIETPWRIIYKIERDYIYILCVFDGRRNLEDMIIKRIIR